MKTDCPKCHGLLIRDYVNSDSITLGMTPCLKCVNCGFYLFPTRIKEVRRA